MVNIWSAVDSLCIFLDHVCWLVHGVVVCGCWCCCGAIFSTPSHPTSQVEKSPCFAAADVRMFSGCQDAQTSNDVTTSYGAGAGAMTTAWLRYIHPPPLRPHPHPQSPSPSPQPQAQPGAAEARGRHGHPRQLRHGRGGALPSYHPPPLPPPLLLAASPRLRR